MDKPMNLTTLLQLVLNCFDAIAVTDTTGKYIYSNKKWKEHVGLSDEDLAQDVYASELFPDSLVPEVIKDPTRIVRIKKDVWGEPALVSYYPLFEQEKLVGILLYSHLTDSEEARTFAGSVLQSLQNKPLTKVGPTSATSRYDISQIIGKSPGMRALRQSIFSASRTNSTVLIEGETGVGKELVAHAIHNLSPRCTKPFIRVNCAAIPAELMEAEFFGYAGGAFTGANRQGRKGKFFMAHEGSMFLDEVNLLPSAMQPKFLRVLQEGEIEQLGETGTRSIDVRIIASTNQSLQALVQEGLFRSDLYYRLNVVNIRIPPLRERKEDIPLLARHIIGKLSDKLGLYISSIDDDVFTYLQDYTWPGNVREMQNILESAMNYMEEGILRVENFQASNNHRPRKAILSAPPAQKRSNENHIASLRTQKAAAQKEELLSALEASQGVITEASALLGISRTTFYKRMKKHNIQL